MRPIPVFIDQLPDNLRPVHPESRAGLEFLLRKMLAEDLEIREAAYILATVHHECGGRWRPIREWGQGKGKPYGTPVGPQAHIYYGRGYVQLTWAENYKRVGRVLGMGDTLVKDPDKALDPEVSWQILLEGMRRGLFTDKKLADFIRPHSGKCDYRGARKIINGVDCAEQIAGYARSFETALAGGLSG